MPAYDPPGGTIKFESEKNAQGRYTALAASGGGGISGLSATLLDGSAAHGNRVRIEADSSYAIGPKDQAAPKRWHMGGDNRVAGISKGSEDIGGGPDLEGVWGGATMAGVIEVVDSNLRHNQVDRQYLSKYRGNIATIGWPDTPLEVGRRFYESYWLRPMQHHYDSKFFPVINVTGTFEINEDFEPGEDVELTTGDGATTISGKITNYDSSTGYMTAYSTEWGNAADGTSSFNGGSVVGLSSGATADIEDGSGSFSSSASTKYGRPGTDAQEPGVYYTYGNNGNGSLFNGAEDADDNPLNGPRGEEDHVNTQLGSPEDTWGDWSRLEWLVDLSSNNDTGGKVYLYLNGSLIYFLETSDTTAIRDANDVISIRNIGMETSAGGTENSAGYSMYWGEIYSDNDTRRLELCDDVTWEGSTVRELQYPEAWTEDAEGAVTIDAELYQGAHAGVTGKYLALVENNTVVFEGLEVPA